MTALTLTNVNKSFGNVHVLKDITLEVEEGEFVVFVGPSGCGKSTLLRVIAGLEDASSGEISIGGHEVNLVPPSKRGQLTFRASFVKRLGDWLGPWLAKPIQRGKIKNSSEARNEQGTPHDRFAGSNDTTNPCSAFQMGTVDILSNFRGALGGLAWPMAHKARPKGKKQNRAWR